MRKSDSWKQPAALGLSVATLLLAGCALFAIGAQSGPLMWTSALGFGEAHDRHAFKVLEKGSSTVALEAAARETSAALRLSPYNNAARLRRAYVSDQRDHRLTGAAIKDLEDTYNLVPYDHTIGGWRIGFVLEHWGQVSPDLRSAVHAEAIAFGRGRSREVNVRRVLQSIHNPEGRVAAALWLRELAR